MYPLISMVVVTAYAVLGQRLTPQDGSPSMDICFADFAKQVPKENYPIPMDLRGVLLGRHNDKPPINMVLYSLYRPDNIEQQDLVLYMQVGECDRTAKKVLRTSNINPYALKIIPEPLIKDMAHGCYRPLKYTLEAHIFGNDRDSDYYSALLARSEAPAELNVKFNDSCTKPSDPTKNLRHDPQACNSRSCYVICGSPDSYNYNENTCACSYDFNVRYTGEIGYTTIMACTVLIPLGILGCCHLATKTPYKPEWKVYEECELRFLLYKTSKESEEASKALSQARVDNEILKLLSYKIDQLNTELQALRAQVQKKL